MIQTTQIKIIW